MSTHNIQQYALKNIIFLFDAQPSKSNIGDDHTHALGYWTQVCGTPRVQQTLPPKLWESLIWFDVSH